MAWTSSGTGEVCVRGLAGLALLGALLGLAGGVPARAETVEPAGPLARIPVAGVAAASVEPVPAWDPASPQRLVRIDGVLYQEEAGFYYRVIDRHVTVRLGEGAGDWETLVRRAATAAPAGFGLLAEARPVRANRLGIVDLELPAGADPVAWAALIHATGLARYAELATHGVYLVTPDDSSYSQQWALNNTGQTGGTAGADLRAEQAWDISAGDPSVVVAVLDSGTDVDHVDLVTNTWINTGEIADNGLDDDGNGFVDDWIGWDFANNNNDPNGPFFHGTHVAGIVYATTNNGTGIAGLAGGFGGPGVRGMALGVGDSSPSGAALDDAILYAADNGADVITMSLSVGSSSAINDALEYAYNDRDVFIDCAAGNNGFSVAYPATRPEVMAVASSTDTDDVSSFSNAGPEVEVAAPGSDILSTQIGDQYGTSSGTSFAAPYVAALAGLIRSVSPGLPAAEVRQLIIDTSDDIEAPGFDNDTGHGRINAFRALGALATSDGTVRLDADAYACAGGIEVTVADVDLAGSGSTTVTLASDSEPAGEILTLAELGGGGGVFRATLPVAAGVPAADGVLQLAHADAIVAEYVDADDGLGGTDVVKTATAATDCLGPIVFEPLVTDIDDTGATVSWTTDEPTTGVVRYGTMPPLTQTAVSTGSGTSHAINVGGLEPCTTYRFQIEATDPLGNATVADNGGLDYVFQTFGDFPGVGVVPCHLGQATLDATSYSCSATVGVTVTDLDLNADSGSVETAWVLMTSTAEPEGEWIPLDEADADSTVFTGSIELDTATAAGDGRLTVAQGNLITVTYYDEDDGEGSSRVAAATAVADCGAPAIGGIEVEALGASRAEIVWTTDEASASLVDYGPTPALGFQVSDAAPKTTHRLPVSAFDACQRVYFRITAADALGNAVVADNDGAPFEFNLSEVGGLLLYDNFETDSGWAMSGEFERGAPQGLGSSTQDPDDAWSGQTIIGADLSGQGAFPGDYETEAKDWALSPTFSTVGVAEPELIFQRKLGVTASDPARVLAQVGATEMSVWSNSGALADTDWVQQRIDLAVAGDAPEVAVRFVVESRDPGQSFGWNVDEVIVKDSTQPDFLACGGCTGAPAFGGLTAVTDAEPCGSGGLTLAWSAAPAWGTGGGGTYSVYRGDSASFSPGPDTLVASGLTATTWVDAAAPVDAESWYVVRAVNDESCTGGAGLDDGNLRRLSATETVAQPAPAVATVLADRVGDAHVRLEWEPVAGAAEYLVEASSSPDFAGAMELGVTAGTFFEDPEAALAGGLRVYRVTPLNACGLP